MSCEAKEKLIAISVKLVSKFGHNVCTPCGGICCKGCARAKGYFNTDWEFQQAKRRYGFDENTKSSSGLGFLGEYGCKIPRAERSVICLSYWCHTVSRKMSAADKQLAINGSQFADAARKASISS